MPTQIRGKCLVVGDAAVGKSALCQAFHSDGQHFPKNYSMTTGVELLVKSLNIPECNETVEIFLYDCAGKEVFFETIQKYWEYPSMIVLVFDVTNEVSFNSCVRWWDRILHLKPNINRPAVLVANKTDLSGRRVVTPKMGEEFALNKGMGYFECSAKETDNIDAPFFHVAKQYHTLYKEKLEQVKDLVAL